MPYTYILECADGSYYTGSTWDLERRLWQHQSGQGANHTKKRLPIKLVYCEPYDRIKDAYYREKQVQGWSRRKKQALIESNTQNLIEFSKNYTEYGRPEDRLASVPASAGSAYGQDNSLLVSSNSSLPEPVEGSTSRGNDSGKFEGNRV